MFPRRTNSLALHCLGGACLFFLAASARGQTQRSPQDLSNLSIESLMNVEVTSVSKREQKLSQAAAAIFVITQEDIRRSGATNIPDLLRMVPGLEVAQIDASTWAISSRGFNGSFANKMLVLVDGRSVYSPLFSGVFWDSQDMILADIERIEVIRGPGATVWGANAVNGVINIITKNSADTQGGALSLGGGNLLHAFGEVRQGGKIGASANYRVYGKYFNIADSIAPLGQTVSDHWQAGRAGFRLDWKSSSRDALLLEGEMYAGQTHQTTTRLVSFSAPFFKTFVDQTSEAGGNALARWTRTLSNKSDLSLQVSFDRTNRSSAIFGENRNTVAADFQHHFLQGARQEFVWGLSYRYTSDGFGSRFGIFLDSTPLGLSTYSAFVQDQISLVANRLFLTVGSKFEHNAFTGVEYQPSARVLWALNYRQTVWGAVARAVRTPARIDRSVKLDLSGFTGPGGLAAIVEISGNPKFHSEDVLAYELGYRLSVSERISFDLASFYNRYQNLRTSETGAPFSETQPAPVHLVIPVLFENRAHGRTYGTELSINWQVAKSWRLSPGYSLFYEELAADPSSTDSGVGRTRSDPRNQFQLRSSLGPLKGVELNSAFYFVGKLPDQLVSSNSRFDSQLAWHAKPWLDLSLVVQNAFKASHQEFGSTQLGQHATLVPRSVYGEIRWRY